MRNLLLALHNLKTLIFEARKLFAVISISMSLSVFGVLFYAGYLLYSYYSGEVGAVVSISLQDRVQANEIGQLLDALMVEEVYFIRMDTKETSQITGEYNKIWDKNILVGKNFTMEENQPKVIMAEWMVDIMGNGEMPIGKKILLDKKEMEVTGIVGYTENDTYVVPISYFIEEYEVNRICYGYQNALKFSDRKKISKILEENTRVDSFDYQVSNPFLTSDFMVSFIQILGIFAVIIMNVFCLCYYWVMHFKKHYRICAMCGSSKSDLRQIIMFQTFILMVISAVAGNLLFILCQQIVKNYNVVYRGSYMPYVIVSVLVLIVLYLICYVLAQKATKKDDIYKTME